jgi:hypothetical protein
MEGTQGVFATLGKYVGTKVLSALIFLGVAGAGIYIWNNPDIVKSAWTILKYALAWIGFALVLPWALFFVTVWVVKADNNLAGALLLIGLLIVDILAALFLMDWHVPGALVWTVLLFGFLSAGVYNFLVCDFQASRLEDGI